jgi:hypothetical protein
MSIPAQVFSVFSNFEKIRYCPRFVCPSVRRRYYFPWAWQIGVVYGSIDSLWPQDMNQGRNFFWTGPGPHYRGLKSKFHIISYKNCILLVCKSVVGPEEKGVTQGVQGKRVTRGIQGESLASCIGGDEVASPEERL